MSIPNAIFVALPEGALCYAAEEKGNVSSLFEFGGITDLDMSNLFSLAVREEFDFDKHELLPLNHHQGQGVFELPGRFISALATIPSADAYELATKWSRTEELNCDPTDLVPIVDHLLKLSKAVDDDHVYFIQQ